SNRRASSLTLRCVSVPDVIGLDEARLAISPHNTQPWRFSRRGDAIVIGWEAERELPSGDPHRRYLLAGLGAAAERMALGGARGAVGPASTHDADPQCSPA